MVTQAERVAPPAGRGARGGHEGVIARGALASLVCAALWVLVHELLAGRAGEWGAAHVALVGCASATLGLTAFAFAPARARELELRVWSSALSLGLGWALLPWALLADWLLVSTHHRPLGAVTFAVAASALALALVLGARQLIVMAEGARGRAALRLGRAIALLGGVAVLALLVHVAVNREQVRSSLLDAGLGFSAAVLVAASSAARWPARAPGWAPLVCVGVWITTLWLVLAQPEVRATVKSTPVIAGVAGFVLR